MSQELYSLRCQDLHNAVNINVDPTSGFLTDYTSTRLIGMAGQVISTLHGMDVVDYKRFRPIAAHQYGVDDMWLSRVLDVLQGCDLVSIQGKPNKPEKIYIKSRYLRSNYSLLSEYLTEDMSPEEIEISTIDILQRLSTSPLTTHDIKDTYTLDNGQIETLKLFGRESQLLQFTELDKGNSLVSTPMYWDENATKAQEIIDQYSSEEFVKAMSKIKANQGFPADMTSDQIMRALVSKGILPAPIVRMNGVDHPFLFTPYNTLPAEKIILEKARDIVACVRTGQHFAKYPIRSPLWILNALIDDAKGYRLKATTVAKEQYYLLAAKGIGILEQTGGEWYAFRLLDTKENISAVKLAIELLEHGERVGDGRIDAHDIRQFLGTQGQSVSAYKSIKEASKAKGISTEIANRLVDLVHGAYVYKGGN